MAATVISSGEKDYYVLKNGVPIAENDMQERARATSIVRMRSKSRPRAASIAAPPFKRLIVAADGTWMNSDNGLLNGRIAVPSNVTRLSRAIKDVSSDGIPQVVYYQFGVGGRGGVLERFVQGTTGEGLRDNVREGYSFLANNYTPGDEIFLVGFSRGAFTVRSIAGLIDIVGLLTKKGLSSLPEVHEDVKNRRDLDYVPKNPNVPFPDKPSAADPGYVRELERRGLTTLGVKIKVIGVWDTVGSLGAPRVGWLTRVGLQQQQSKETSFYDTKLGNCVENAFQALALDERRSAFAPAIWEKPPGNKTTLRQVWFPGAHSNIGGGEDDQQLANITLAWMMSQMEPFLDLRMDYILEQDDASDAYYSSTDQPPRPYSFGRIPNSMTGLYAIGGGKTRTPGSYHCIDPLTGRANTRLLADTHEYIHPSVRTRMHFRGPGIADKGAYSAAALANWNLNITYSHSGPDPDVFWKLPRDLVEKGQNRVLPESPLWRIERELARRDPETFDYITKPAPTGHAGAKTAKRKSKRVAEAPSRRARSVDFGPASPAAPMPPSPRGKSKRRGASRRRPSMDTWEMEDEYDGEVDTERERGGERDAWRMKDRERDRVRGARSPLAPEPPGWRRSDLRSETLVEDNRIREDGRSRSRRRRYSGV